MSALNMLARIKIDGRMVLAVSLLAFLFTAAVSCLKEAYFWNSAYDFGIHVQAIWKMSALRGLFNTVRGLPIWGDHVWFIMPIFAVPYALFSSPYTLLVLQAALIVSGFPAVYFLARSRGLGEQAAFGISLIYLLYPSTFNMILDNFHPEIAATTFLLWAFVALDRERHGIFAACIALALLCKEDVALPISVYGVILFLQGKRKTGAIVFFASIVYFAVAMKVVLPAMNGNGFFRFSGGYWFSDFANNWNKPNFYIRVFLDPKSIEYVVKLFVPLAFLPLIDFPALFPAFVPMAINILSRTGYLISGRYHYEFTIIPFFFLAFIGALVKLDTPLRRKLFLPLTMAALLGFFWNTTFGLDVVGKAPQLLTSQSRQQKLEAISLIPKDPKVTVSASHWMVTKLANRDSIYMFPNPWKAQYWGIDGEQYPSGVKPSWVIVDISTIGDENAALFKRIAASGEYEAIYSSGTLHVIKRVSE